MPEIVFEIKDLVWFICLLFSVFGGIFSFRIANEKNKMRIQSLQDQINQVKTEAKGEKERTDKIHVDLTEVKGLLMEIKGFLKIKNN